MRIRITSLQVFFAAITCFGFVPNNSRAEEIEPSVQRTLVVSDIDDTLKMTHVKFGFDFIDFFSNALRSDNSFVGMPELVGKLSAQGANIAYVTALPEAFSFHAINFLKASKLPKGQLICRDGLFTNKADFKTNAVLSLIKASNPDRVILFGDNAEADETAFRRVKNKLAQDRSKMTVHAFIHDLYSDKTIDPAINRYVTAADLAAQLYLSQLLSAADASQIIRRTQASMNFRDSDWNRRALPEFAELSLRQKAQLERTKNLLRDHPAVWRSYSDYLETLARFRGLSCLQAVAR